MSSSSAIIRIPRAVRSLGAAIVLLCATCLSATVSSQTTLQGVPSLEALRGVTAPQPTASELLDRARAAEQRQQVPQPAGRPPLTQEQLTRFASICRARERDNVPPIGLTGISRLEVDYCKRVGAPLFQFGYDTFAQDVTQSATGVGAIPDDYVLGIGDELIVTFHGQTSGTHAVRVDSEGRVILPDMLPIPAAGRTFGEFRGELEARTQAAFLGTGVFVSIASVRQITLTVVGEVRRPGLHRLTALSTFFDAIAIAGGIAKTGSLRKIIVQRGNRIFGVDLYDVLLTGVFDYKLTLFDGDRIFVPTVGATAAIAGDVNRPGIYEFPEGARSVSLANLLSYAGGTLRPTGQTFLKISFVKDGREVVTERLDRGGTVAAGDIVMVRPQHDIQGGSVELVGHVAVPGPVALKQAPTVSALIGGRDTLSDPYMLFAVLETTDPATRARRLFPINLERILAREEDYSLRDGDRLIVLSRDDIRYLMSTDVKNLILGRPIAGLSASPSVLRAIGRQTAAEESGAVTQERQQQPQQPQQPQQQQQGNQVAPASKAQVCPGLQALAMVIAVGKTQRYDSALLAGLSESDVDFDLSRECPEIFRTYPDVLPFALEHVVAMNGEIRRPGAYPVTPGTRLSSLISVADGLTRDSDRVRVELSRIVAGSADSAGKVQRSTVDISGDALASTRVEPSDIVRFNARFVDRDNAPVVLSGEFVRPGLYAIRRGERLSEVIKRAGGLTEQAYPYGAIFTRERVKRAEALALRRAAREIDSTLSVLASKSRVDASQLAALTRLSQQLESAEAIGRVVMEADPTVLQVRPELDTVLEASDRLFMPKRPNYVTVSGDVLSPTTVQFRPGQTVDDYINKAGGYQVSADDDRIFVVYPNGEARKVGSNWNFEPAQVPPGSTIVVPRNPSPFDFLEFARDITPILSNLAVTAASLAVVGRN